MVKYVNVALDDQDHERLNTARGKKKWPAFLMELAQPPNNALNEIHEVIYNENGERHDESAEDTLNDIIEIIKAQQLDRVRAVRKLR